MYFCKEHHFNHFRINLPCFNMMASEEVKIVAKLGEMFHYLSSSVKEGGRRRTVLLWGLKCWLLTGGKHSCLSALPQLLSEFSGRRDVRGLVEAAKITFNSGNCDPAVLEFQVSALSQAITLEPSQRRKELIGAGALEVLSHLPLLPGPQTSQLATEIISLQWSDKVLLAEVIKISWNSWVKAVSSSGSEDVKRFWLRLLATLHNSVSERGDEIAGEIERPSPGNTSSLVIPTSASVITNTLILRSAQTSPGNCGQYFSD